MYRNQKKKGKKKERSKTSLNSLALRNARTFRLLSLRVRCIRDFFSFVKCTFNYISKTVNNTITARI